MIGAGSPTFLKINLGLIFDLNSKFKSLLPEYYQSSLKVKFKEIK